MIKANKTFTINIPIVTKEYPERNMVRTGTYGDGNCFFHALLRAIDTGYRRQNSYHFHLKLVERFRQDISEWITHEHFQALGKGEQLRLSFLTELNELLDKNYNQIDQHPSPVIRIIYKLISKEEIEKQVIPESINKSNFYLAFCSQMESLVRKKLTTVNQSKVDALCKELITHFIQIFKTVHDNSLENFKRKFSKMGEYTDSTQMECIARYTGYNFIFIHHEQDNQPVQGLTHIVSFDSNLKTLIFLWVDENHFEIIGELEDKNLINRVFDSKDPVVELLSRPNTQLSL